MRCANPARHHDVLAVLAGAHQDPGEARAERATDVGLDIVADHHRVGGGRAGIGERLLEERGRRLADDRRLRPVAYSSAATNGPTSSDSPSARCQKRFF